jgi:hypothetical protein
MKLAEHLHAPPAPDRWPRLRKWLIIGALEVGLAAAVLFFVARAGVSALDEAKAAVSNSEAALRTGAQQSIALAEALMRVAGHKESQELPPQVDAIRAAASYEEIRQAADRLDAALTLALATAPPSADRRLERQKAALSRRLAAVTKARASNWQSLTLARGKQEQVTRRIPVRLALFLRMARAP